jgi:hypothetical protein
MGWLRASFGDVKAHRTWQAASAVLEAISTRVMGAVCAFYRTLVNDEITPYWSPLTSSIWIALKSGGSNHV